MQLANAPIKIVEAFATGDTTKNVIPVPSQIPITPGAASWTDGFPPLTAVDPVNGGIGPSKADFNGVLFSISDISQWLNAGGGFLFDAAFAATVGGYPVGARVLRANQVGYWFNTVDGNSNNPDTGGAGWVPDGAAICSSVYASAQQTLAVGVSKILFDTIEFDDGLWSAGFKRFQAPYPGRYRMSGVVTLIGSGGQQLFTQINHNGSLAKFGFQSPQLSDGNLSYPFSAIVNMAVGDFLEAFLNVTQTPVLAGQVGSNQAFVFAQCEYLGA